MPLAMDFGIAEFTSGFTFAFVLLVAACFEDVDVTRLDKPKRCTFPITAFLVTPPNALAIMLAD
jgi:hypothetical protein